MRKRRRPTEQSRSGSDPYRRPMRQGKVAAEEEKGMFERVLGRVSIAMAATACVAWLTIAHTAPSAAGIVDRATRGTEQPALPAYLTLTGGGRPVPASFFGLSVEYKELRTYIRSGALFDRVISLIRPRDGSPLLLRIGGKSADHVWWETANGRPPKWVTKIGDPWLRDLAGLVRRDDLRVMLDLNLAVHSSRLAATFAAAAVKALPRSSIAALEIGNEPDQYWRQPWLEKQRIRTTGAGVPLHWTHDYSDLDYRRDYEVYARALAAKVPGIPLGGPEIISSKSSWLATMTGLGALNPKFLAIHRYASSTCWPPWSPYYPTIPMLLANTASAGLAGTVGGAAAFAHANGMALRLTEVNSISCGGNSGVADSFATALWAPDALFEMLRAGIDGVNWHIRPRTINAPFQLDAGGIVPLPELYGLAVFAQMTHGPSRLLDSTLSSSAGLDLKAWAVQRHVATTVLLINKGAREADVRLPAVAATQLIASVRRLEAPSIEATRGLRFAGRSIGTDARWHGHDTATAVRQIGGFYYVLVPGYSAAEVSLGQSEAGPARRSRHS
jgi:hypothetical protein